jgi:hypothetical protein
MRLEDLALPIDDNVHEALLAKIPLIKSPSRNPARNAVHSLDMAWRIKEIDPEIAAFRGIHAEEEAAAALFGALKFKRYAHAEKLNPYDHRHKCAVQPYYDVVVRELRRTKLNAAITPQWSPDRPGHGFSLRVTVPTESGGEESYVTYEPLSFSTHAEGTPETFREYFESAVRDANARNTFALLRELAEQRNRALYATARGIPKFVGDINDALLERRNRVFRVLLIFVLIMFESEPQSFIQQVLPGFVDVLKRMPAEDL